MGDVASVQPGQRFSDYERPEVSLGVLSRQFLTIMTQCPFDVSQIGFGEAIEEPFALSTGQEVFGGNALADLAPFPGDIPSTQASLASSRVMGSRTLPSVVMLVEQAIDRLSVGGGEVVAVE
jgi:hypothetical protein